MNLNILSTLAYILPIVAILLLFCHLKAAQKFAINNKIIPQSLFSYALLGLMAGILSEKFASTSYLALIIVPASLAFMFISKHPSTKIRCSLAAFFFLIGEGCAHITKLRHTLIRQALLEQNATSIKGSVTEIDRYENKKYGEVLQITTKLAPCNTQISIWREEATIQIFCRNQSNIELGDEIEIPFPKLCAPKPKPQEGTRTGLEDYMILHEIHAHVFIPALSFTLLHRYATSFQKATWKTCQRVNQGLKKNLNFQAFSLLSSIFLGNKKQIHPKLLQEKCAMWGISHYLARSGLHLALLYGFWWKALGILPIGLFAKHIVLAFFLMLYALLTWGSISFCRALAMALITTFGAISIKEARPAHTLQLVALFILLSKPGYLLFLDFQLSFLLTYALCIL